MTLDTYITSNNFNTLSKNYAAGNILEENLKGSQISNTILLKYFNQRAIIEKEYCEKLSDLSKIFDDSAVVGRVKNIFNVTKNELLLVSNIKLNLYDLINNQYEKSFAELSSQQNEEFQNYYDNITNERKKLIDTHKEKEEKFKEYSIVKNELIELINEYKKNYDDNISKKIEETFEKEKKLRIKYIFSKDKYDKEKRTCMTNHNETSESFVYLERERTEFIIKHLTNYINNLILISRQELESYNYLINDLNNIYSSNDNLDDIALQFNDLLNSKDENSVEQVNKEIEDLQSEYKNEKKLKKFRKNKKKQNTLHVQNVTETESEFSEKNEDTMDLIKSEENSPEEEIINISVKDDTNITNEKLLAVNDNDKGSTMSSLLSKHSSGLINFNDLIETMQNYDRTLDHTNNSSVNTANTVPNNNNNNNNKENDNEISENLINKNLNNVDVKLKLNDTSFDEHFIHNKDDSNKTDNVSNNKENNEIDNQYDQFNNKDIINKTENNVINENVINNVNNENDNKNVNSDNISNMNKNINNVDNTVSNNEINNNNNNNNINNNNNNNSNSNSNSSNNNSNNQIQDNKIDHEKPKIKNSPDHQSKSPLQIRSYSQGVISSHNQNQHQIRANKSFSAHSSPMFKKNSNDSHKAESIKSTHSKSSFGSMLSSIFQSQSHSSHKHYKNNEDRFSINSEALSSPNISPSPRRLSSKQSVRVRPQSVLYYPKNNDIPLNRQFYYKPPSNSRNESLSCTLNRIDKSRDEYYIPQLRESIYAPNSPLTPSLNNNGGYIPNRSPNIPYIDINPPMIQDNHSFNEMENTGKIIQTMNSNSSLNNSISSKTDALSQKMNNKNVSSTLNYNYDPYDTSIVKPILFYVRVLFDYNSQIYEEISVRKDMIIPILETQEDGWWEGEIEEMGPTGKRRRRGLLPSNFVEIIKKI
ncbi:hypothetical protein U3516DRAFT_235287 [Neocallimastix sp. 'constans']|jgi:hypothetical protein